MATQAQATVNLPRVEIKFCVQCKWNLRAAYYAQELMQTFSNTIGEIALVPVTGGIFTITLQQTSTTDSVSTTQIWDRKADGGFPETKELKNRVRNLIDPDRDMGHIDRSLKKAEEKGVGSAGGEREKEMGKERHQHQHPRSGKTDEGEPGETRVEDCEECRLVAREALEEQIGRVASA